MPALGMAQETGKLVRWLKREGDTVEKGEPLMEVETDKATVEVESPASGTLASVGAAEGDDVAVGRAIALILAAGEAARPLTRHEPQPQPVQSASGVAPSPPAGSQPGAGARPAASPKARRLAAERGVELSALTGSGPAGAVLEEDVLQAGATSGPAESSLWRAMAGNVSRSWREAPHFFVIREVDATALVGRRGAEAADVTFTDLLVEAVAAALASHPRMNGGRREVNVGLAVAVPDGLLVPVIHGADRLPLPEIAARRRELVGRVKAGRLHSTDLTGGTFTLSNLGMHGVDLFTAIVTEGQAGILAVGRIADRAVAHKGEVRVRPAMMICLSCDHRRVDGARAAEFMQTLAGLLERG